MILTILCIKVKKRQFEQLNVIVYIINAILGLESDLPIQ
jgi:hypothetical protein